MGIVMTVVVLGAAVVNIWTQRQIQLSIVKMTHYHTDVTVFREIPIPECSAELYDPEKGKKKHILFAGTHVLSSGRSEEILAIVQTTGAHTTKHQLLQSILFPIPMRFKYNEHPKVLVAILFVYTFIVCSISTYFVMNNHMINNQYATFFTSIFMLSAVDAPSFAELLYALTTSCHSVDSLKDFLVGNEVEVRMFAGTG
ncbi:P-type ATPase (P-ATPase) Superfamily [Phytophthora palmivora]|uniref:P-type ATPase (P-ATPase) Superfamily n=1 Tax=Phytophthora palmivora TaxID=4796 RepID=A0A2P4XZV6_9STRA|nr:P-type ATPase (P-ATPase) Superfamily [Phytophthora palmivora]